MKRGDMMTRIIMAREEGNKGVGEVNGKEDGDM